MIGTYINTLKRLFYTFILSTSIYCMLLFVSVTIFNSNSKISFAIEPYIYGSEPLDLFFGLIISLSFFWYIYFQKKDGFFKYISVRTSLKHYIASQFAAICTLCFFMIFVSNFFNVIISLLIANIDGNAETSKSLSMYIAGNLQMDNPVIFGFFWCIYKAFLGSLICFMSLTYALYIKNFFLGLFLPFVYIFLENFTTGVLNISQFSFSTAFILNRLSPEAMKVNYIVTSIVLYIVIITVNFLFLRWKSEKSKI